MTNVTPTLICFNEENKTIYCGSMSGEYYISKEYIRKLIKYAENTLFMYFLHNIDIEKHNQEHCERIVKQFYTINDNNIVKPEKSKVYLMIDHNTGYYKIGRSKNPQKRENTLQSEKPTIELLFSSDELPIDIEKLIHNEFSNKRVRGEWFDLTEEDVDYIKKRLS